MYSRIKKIRRDINISIVEKTKYEHAIEVMAQDKYGAFLRASASLTRISEAGQPIESSFKYLNLDVIYSWWWFNRLINKSGVRGLGEMILIKLMDYCDQHKYAILNQVSAYERMGQKMLEDIYMSRGFQPLDYIKYKNAVLIRYPGIHK